MRQVMTFDDAFITGVAEIDDQHRNLISLTNEAGVILLGNPRPAVVKNVVQELLSYAIYHFRTEEALMREYGYVERDQGAAEAHVGCHRDFSSQVVETQETLQRGDYVDPDALLGFLRDWIRGHILGTDQHLAAFILAQREGGGATPLSPAG